MAAGGAMVIKQAELSPQRIADIISDMARNPDKASAMAAAAKASAKPEASRLLADLAEAIASGKSVSDFKKDVRA